MGTQTNHGARVLALAAFTVLTVVLAFSLGMQVSVTPGSSREAEAARIACQDRLVHAAEAAWADGDAELARWIESLPSYPEHRCAATEPR
jgi:hypothetical protein